MSARRGAGSSSSCSPCSGGACCSPRSPCAAPSAPAASTRAGLRRARTSSRRPSRRSAFPLARCLRRGPADAVSDVVDGHRARGRRRSTSPRWCSTSTTSTGAGPRSPRCATRSRASATPASRCTRASTGGGDAEYFLRLGGRPRSRCRRPPSLQLDGLTASALFLRGTLDKLDISPNFAHVGRYKSAVESYTRTGHVAAGARGARRRARRRVPSCSSTARRRARPAADSVRAPARRGPVRARAARSRAAWSTRCSTTPSSTRWRRAEAAATSPPTPFTRYLDG